MKQYIEGKNVLEAARERIAYVFDRFDRICVSISGGKDSTVLYHLVLDEAIRRDRRIEGMFLDQEAEYAATIRLMREMMQHPNVIPIWFQVPIRLTNATSYAQEFLYAWEPGAEWIREKELGAIHEIDRDYPQRFYPFFEWFEETRPEGTAYFVGLRAEESLNRFRAVTKNPGYHDVLWSTKTQNTGSYRFYPIYDWGSGDVWKYIYDTGIKYNEIYDKMFANGTGIYSDGMRVSNLVHEKSFKSLTDLQVLEPETFDRITRRIGGAHCAAIYAKEKVVYNAEQRPTAFATWRAYRDYLLESAPIPADRRARFIKRFEEQGDDEEVCRQQCKQILINDWENNIPVVKKKRGRTLDRWWDLL